MNEMKFWWHRFLLVGALIVLVCLFLLFVFCMATPKHVVGYYLADQNNMLAIGVDIENHPDDFIPLNGISVREAITMIDSLNQNLKVVP